MYGQSTSSKCFATRRNQRYFYNGPRVAGPDGDELRRQAGPAHLQGPAADEESGSKPESETTAGDARTLDAIFTGLGYVHLVAFGKRCVNYAFTSHGREMLASLVTVPELDGTFLEVETLAAADEVEDALRAVRNVMAELGIAAADLTSDQYTEAVLAARSQKGS